MQKLALVYSKAYVRYSQNTRQRHVLKIAIKLFFLTHNVRVLHYNQKQDIKQIHSQWITSPPDGIYRRKTLPWWIEIFPSFSTARETKPTGGNIRNFLNKAQSFQLHQLAKRCRSKTHQKLIVSLIVPETFSADHTTCYKTSRHARIGQTLQKHARRFCWWKHMVGIVFTREPAPHHPFKLHVYFRWPTLHFDQLKFPRFYTTVADLFNRC